MFGLGAKAQCPFSCVGLASPGVHFLKVLFPLVKVREGILVRDPCGLFGAKNRDTMFSARPGTSDRQQCCDGIRVGCVVRFECKPRGVGPCACNATATGVVKPGFFCYFSFFFVAPAAGAPEGPQGRGQFLEKGPGRQRCGLPTPGHRQTSRKG